MHIFQKKFWRRLADSLANKLKRRWHVRYKYNKKHLVMDLAIAAAVLAIVAANVFLLFGGWRYFSDKLTVEISLSAEPVTLGAVSTITIDYDNQNDFELDGAVLSWRLPPNFELLQWPREADGSLNSLNLGRLAPKANGRVVLLGRFWGNFYDEQAIFANLSYYKTDEKGGRLWGQFNHGVLRAVVLRESVLQLISTMPEKVLAGQKFHWEIIAKNSGEMSLAPLKLILTPTEGLVCSEQEKVFDIGLRAGENLAWSLTCAVAPEIDDLSPRVRALWLDNGKEFVLRYLDVAPEVKQSGWRLSLNSAESAATPGASVPVSIDYRNEGGEPLADMKIKLRLFGAYWRPGADLAGGVLQDDTIVWAAKQIPELMLVEPGDAGTLNLRLPLRESVAANRELNVAAELSAEFSYAGAAVEFAGGKITWKLRSNLSAVLSAQYFTAEGDQLGRGPWPPVAGKETKVWVFVKLVNDLAAVRDVRLSARLPVNVSLTGKGSVPLGEPLAYDESARVLSWKINELPAGSAGLGFAFETALIPTQKQTDGAALLTDIKISGTDKETGDYLEKNLGSLSVK